MNKHISNYKTALYCRLSKDDENAGESSSIINQKKMLYQYAIENGFINYEYYIDDGYSGTNFDRPAFKNMINDIENREINLVITKDLSRLGRDYITTGQYTEIYFPSKNVRYIAINDGYDTDNINNDIAPFKNIVNEMYARDISKKIKSAFITKMNSGEYIGNFAPYGYQKDPDNKNKLIVDKEAAHIVKKIFAMAKSGLRLAHIRDYLIENKIPTPAEYRCSKFQHLNVNNYSKRKEWNSHSIYKILNNPVYLGHTAQGKTNKISFKSDKIIVKSREDWILIKHTHEPIIDEETFETVRKHEQERTYRNKSKFQNVFSGIAKCSDCGRNMSTTGSGKKENTYYLVCSGYKSYGSKECTNHFINYNDLYNQVLEELKKYVYLSAQDINEIIKNVKYRFQEKESSQNKYKKQEIDKLNSRSKEIDKVILRLYEDNISLKINDERFKKLLSTYETEQKEIKEKISKLSYQEKNKKDIQLLKKYYEFIKKHIKLQELTPDILYELIDKVEISQCYYDKEKRKHQDIKIYYKFTYI